MATISVRSCDRCSQVANIGYSSNADDKPFINQVSIPLNKDQGNFKGQKVDLCSKCLTDLVYVWRENEAPA